MKTFKQWHKSKKCFSDFCKEWEIVDNYTVDYFEGCMPPIRKKTKYFIATQCPEPLESKDGNFIYTTFVKFTAEEIEGDKTKLDVWYYVRWKHLDKIK